MDVSATRMVVLSATVIALVTFVLPWARLPKAFLNLLFILMAVYITALAHASGAVADDLMMLVTFAIALAVCFLPVRTGVVEVVIIAVLLAAGLILLDKEDAGVEALRISLLLSVLVVLCGLVLILRAVIAERESVVGRRLFDEGVLDEHGFVKMLDRELSRAARHDRPLSVVLFEISGPQDNRVASAATRALLDRLRIEDGAGHLGGRRFAVIAPETNAEGAASVAETITDVMQNEFQALGHDPSSFKVAAGWADYPHHADSRAGLLEKAKDNLDAAAIRDQLRPSPAHSAASPHTRPAAARPDQR
jgi:diguanylate cyclase (GGDEF)-like protein